MNLREDLKQRKIVQWSVAYLAAAWLVDVLGGRWGISDSSARIIDVALFVGFFIALTVAWYLSGMTQAWLAAESSCVPS
jgi:hypothetical protein